MAATSVHGLVPEELGDSQHIATKGIRHDRAGPRDLKWAASIVVMLLSQKG